MCFMTFVSLSSCRLLLLQRWDNKWTETEDCRLYVICRYYFRLSVQNADMSAMISSGSEHTGRHSQDPAIWCDMLPHNNKTLQHGAGGMSAGCSVHCCSTACNRRCLLRRSRRRPGVPRCRLPGRTEIFLLRISLTVLTDAPNQEQRSTETIVRIFCLDHLALKLESILIAHHHSKATKFYHGSEETRLWMWHSPIRLSSVAKLWFVWKAVPSLHLSYSGCDVLAGEGEDWRQCRHLGPAPVCSSSLSDLQSRAVITGGSHRLLSTLSTRTSNEGPHVITGGEGPY